MEEIINNACIDNYDERTFNYEEIAGAETNLPAKVLLETNFCQNQKTDGYNYGCVYYSSAEGSNYLTKARLLGKDFIKNSKTRKEGAGDFTINGVKLLVLLGIIKAYAQISSIKQTIANGSPVLTGSNKIDWKATKANNNIAVPGTGYGHAFHIIGYDDSKQVYICKNSYGPSYMDKGNFYIKYEDVDSVLHNTKIGMIANENLLINYKQKLMDNLKLEGAKKAFELGIWNGENPNNTASREEVSAMLYRLYEKLQK